MFQTIPRATFASRSDRLFGQLLDAIVGGAPALVGVFAGLFIPMLGEALVMAGVLWGCFYYLFADGFEDGQSYGKRWIGMRVVDSQTGKPCTFGQSFLRNLVLTALGPFDWIFIFGENHQRLGDKAAGTIVIYD
jgi:uncharacterized RDD family membrane protein YckC